MNIRQIFMPLSFITTCRTGNSRAFSGYQKSRETVPIYYIIYIMTDKVV